MTEPRRDPWLLTPGLLTASRTVKEAMLHDRGSRDAEMRGVLRAIGEIPAEMGVTRRAPAGR